jgi:Flp pilus assembly protein TadD
MRNLAIALRGSERYAEAIKQYEQVVRHKPDDAGAQYDLANCYEKMGQVDAAAKAYEKYATLVRLKDPKGAERAQERATSLKNP